MQNYTCTSALFKNADTYPTPTEEVSCGNSTAVLMTITSASEMDIRFSLLF
jgi:hypothetical protein